MRETLLTAAPFLFTALSSSVFSFLNWELSSAFRRERFYEQSNIAITPRFLQWDLRSEPLRPKEES